MSTIDDEVSRVRFSVRDLGDPGIDSWMDIHPHTSFSDGKLSLDESLREAYRNNLYEKGAIEHGNPLDEDIDHMTTFLQEDGGGNEPYTSSFIYKQKFEAIKEILEDFDGGTVLTQADPEKLREDIETIEELTRKNSGSMDQLDRSLNYSMVVPHGVELDYNPVIEAADNNAEVVDSYEEGLIEFLREAESFNAGYNFILLSSHYVNTPFRPRYVKKDELFQDMSHEELGDVLENYRTKEISKIESMASKLGDMTVPGVSEELMKEEEVQELEEFIYDQSHLFEQEVDQNIAGDEMIELSDQNLEERPGVFVAGAHPTLIERNEEFMDYFRKEQGLPTRDESSSGNYVYPEEALEEFYRPMIEAAKDEENFIFEVNGKGLERQHPSVFWQMLNEKTFGSDSHRLGEQPSRSREFEEQETSGDTVFLSDKWVSMLENNPVESGSE